MGTDGDTPGTDESGTRRDDGKADEPDQKNEEYTRFQRLTQALLQVPKEEIDKVREQARSKRS